MSGRCRCFGAGVVSVATTRTGAVVVAAVIVIPVTTTGVRAAAEAMTAVVVAMSRVMVIVHTARTRVMVIRVIVVRVIVTPMIVIPMIVTPLIAIPMIATPIPEAPPKRELTKTSHELIRTPRKTKTRIGRKRTHERAIPTAAIRIATARVDPSQTNVV